MCVLAGPCLCAWRDGLLQVEKNPAVHEPMVLGLLWTLILEFDINRAMKVVVGRLVERATDGCGVQAAAASQAVADNKNSFNFKPGQAKDALLAWVRSRVAKCVLCVVLLPLTAPQVRAAAQRLWQGLQRWQRAAGRDPLAAPRPV